MELRETSLLQDLTPNPTVAAVGLHMAGYELLKPSIWTILIDKCPPVPESQIIRNRRFRHLGGIGPPRLSESHPRQAYRRRKHGSSMAAGQHTQQNKKQRAKLQGSQHIARRFRHRTKRHYHQPPLLYGTSCDGGRLHSPRTPTRWSGFQQLSPRRRHIVVQTQAALFGLQRSSREPKRPSELSSHSTGHGGASRIRTSVEWTPGLARGRSRRREIRSSLFRRVASRVDSWPKLGGIERVPGASVKRNKASPCGFVEPRGWDLITGKYPLCSSLTRPSVAHSFQQQPHQLKNAARQSTRAPEPSIQPSSCTRSICSQQKASSRGSGRQTGPRD
ncbi:uncharacterized protein LOC119769236 [Culex quinquefasciatus]|uniref:uncharacterized protein LOC119769236 n=1 Tax=Culex quinquefasciatus TaxID=7176 RepID=UPI0018E2FB12|nr:uncharacterized protein LOC119769236 [Culex quinquefasciatus]